MNVILFLVFVFFCHKPQYLRVTFDPETGLLSSLSNLETKQSIKLRQNFYWFVFFLSVVFRFKKKKSIAVALLQLLFICVLCCVLCV